MNDNERWERDDEAEQLEYEAKRWKTEAEQWKARYVGMMKESEGISPFMLHLWEDAVRYSRLITLMNAGTLTVDGVGKMNLSVAEVEQILAGEDVQP